MAWNTFHQIGALTIHERQDLVDEKLKERSPPPEHRTIDDESMSSDGGKASSESPFEIPQCRKSISPSPNISGSGKKQCRRAWTHWRYKEELNQWEFTHRIARVQSLEREILDTLPLSPFPQFEVARVNMITGSEKKMDEMASNDSNLITFPRERIIRTPSPVPGPIALDDDETKRRRAEHNDKYAKDRPGGLFLGVNNKRSWMQMKETDTNEDGYVEDFAAVAKGKKKIQWPYRYCLYVEQNGVMTKFFVDALGMHDAWLKYLDIHQISSQFLLVQKNIRLTKIRMVRNYIIESLLFPSRH